MATTEPQLLLSYQPAKALPTLVSPYGSKENLRKNVVYPMATACLIGLGSRETSEAQKDTIIETLRRLSQH